MGTKKNPTLTNLTNAGRKRPVKKPRKAMNHVILVLDQSSSMNGIREDAALAFSNQVAGIRAAAAKEKQPVTVSTILFADTVQLPVQDFDVRHYRPYGNTNLYGAIVDAVNHVNKVRTGKDTALVVVITDGQENRNVFTRTQVRDIIGAAMEDENFNIVGNAPPGGRNTLIDIGIPAANVTEWEATSQGVTELSSISTRSFGNYFNSVSLGHSPRAATVSYMANMNAIAPADVNKMTDVSDQFKRWRVSAGEGGQEISDFVRSKGVVYSAGRAFYELTKPEKVTANKTLVILDKQTGAIYSGDQARRKLGLPVGRDIRVKPGSSGEFTLFIQSTSYNRKIVGGTTLIYQT
jgi:hypothetical protein